MRRPDSQTGFTLPEVATVLVIIGLILPLIFAAARTQLLQSQVSKSKANIEQVKLALQRYVASTGRMPCPAAVNLPQTSPNFGREQTPAANVNPCNGAGVTQIGAATAGTRVYRGLVPWWGSPKTTRWMDLINI